MSTPDTKITISLETLLKGVDKTVRGLDTVEKRLKAFANVKPLDKASLAAQRLVLQQQRLTIQAQVLANRQEKARQTTERLARSQQKLAEQSTKAAQKLGQNADAHTRAFRAMEAAAKKAKAQVDKINAETARQARQQERIRVAAARSIARAQTTTAKQGADALISSLNKSGKTIERVDGLLTRMGGTLTRIGSGLQSFGRSLTIGLTAPLAALGAISVKSAKDIDAIRNRLIATEGSVEAANKRLAQLNQLADESVGVTRGAAQDAFAALSVIGGITERTINRQIKALGRLNAAFTIEDQPQFFRNLVQIFSQGFERADVKEAIGRVPIFNQLLESAFGTADADKLRELKASGKLTLDTFLAGLAEAVESNPALAKIGESIGTRLSKTFEKLTNALAPLGDAILRPIERLITIAEPLILKLADAFKSLSPSLQNAVVLFGVLAAVAGPVLIVIGGLVSAIGSLIPLLSAVAGVVATIGLPGLVAAVAGLVVVIGEWITILALLGKAWQTNFLNIRGLVTDAANAILQAFNRIKAIFDEAVQRILPTLQSITTRILGVITATWEKYGKDIVRVVGAAFRFISEVTETFLRQFANFVDLVLKLIDGDFRGAWSAFARILLEALEGWQRVMIRLQVVAVRAFALLVRFILDQAFKLAEAGRKLASDFLVALAFQIVAGAPKIRQALLDMLLIAVAGMDPATIAGMLVARFIAALRRAAAEGVTTGTGANVGVDVGSGAGIRAPQKTASLATEVDKKGAKALRDAQKDFEEQQREFTAAQAQARLDLARQGIEQQFALTKDGLDRELELLQGNFDERLVAVKKYFAERKRIQEAQIDTELVKEKALTGQLADEFAARRREINAEFQATVDEINQDPKLKGRAKDTALQTAELKKQTELSKAQNDFENQLADVSTRILLLIRQRARLTEDLVREEQLLTEEIQKQADELKFDLLEEQGRSADAAAGRLKARFKETLDGLRIDFTGLAPELQSALNSVDLTALKTRLSELPEPVRALIELLDIGIKRAQIFESSKLVDTLETGLRTQEDAIQQKVLDGVISEKEARDEIVALQREYKAHLLDILAGELAKARAIQDQDEIAQIEAQIAGVQRLGVEIDELAIQINQGLFADLESGFANIFTSARRGIEGVEDAFIDLGFSILDTLSRIAANQLVEKLFGNLLKPAATNTAGTLGGLLSGLGGFAAGDIIPPRQGGRIVNVAEGGYPEAILTTDPKYADRQFNILRTYLRETKGLFGRIPKFAAGGLVSPRQTEMDLLGSIQRSPSLFTDVSELSLAGPSAPSVNLRNINLIDRAEMVRGYLQSPEGARDLVNMISQNRDEIGRRIGVK